MSVSAPHFLLFAQATGNMLVGAGASTPSEAEIGGRWRFVIQSDDGKTVLDAEDEEDGDSRERLELLAIVRGLEALDQPSQVTLVTHSRAVSRGLTEGLVQWRENDWQWERFGSLTPVKNSDLWRRVDQAMSIHQVKCRLATSGGSDDLNMPQPSSSPGQARSTTRQLRERQLRFDPGTPTTDAADDSTPAKLTPRRTRARQPAVAGSLIERTWSSVQQLFGR
ncbi:Ribonuclease HI [Anatilimnocola aggregata]|uniref:Ribonuclease HI n=1 Tax=Anatilimnocola aggregata TaxID=2528021 RepID=A0A517YI68_9BACT|nr:RNase H family protein [Anatilimnocola aggregata]QDU29918.1 Ribonuclease HI [Anatilimnocola aggregata]